ncbi:MAG: SPOR domain-containing protein [Candidatus Methylomirabilia bacterium]
MSRSYDDRKRRGRPTHPGDYEPEEESAESPVWRLFEKGSFRALLGALALVALAFTALPYLLDRMTSSQTRNLAVETPSLIALKPPVSPTPGSPTGPPAVRKFDTVYPPALPPTTTPESDSAAPAARVTAGAEPQPGVPGTRETTAPARSNGGFWVQVGAFKNPEYAARVAARLSARHYPVVIRRREAAAALHVVWAGRYPSRKRAEEVRAALEKKGFPGFVLREEGP